MKGGDQKRGLCNLTRMTHKEVRHHVCRVTGSLFQPVFVYFIKNLGESGTSASLK
jgi:hypothetical protein